MRPAGPRLHVQPPHAVPRTTSAPPPPHVTRRSSAASSSSERTGVTGPRGASCAIQPTTRRSLASPPIHRIAPQGSESHSADHIRATPHVTRRSSREIYISHMRFAIDPSQKRRAAARWLLFIFSVEVSGGRSLGRGRGGRGGVVGGGSGRRRGRRRPGWWREAAELRVPGYLGSGSSMAAGVRRGGAPGGGGRAAATVRPAEGEAAPERRRPGGAG